MVVGLPGLYYLHGYYLDNIQIICTDLDIETPEYTLELETKVKRQTQSKVHNHREGPYYGLLLVESAYISYLHKTPLRHYVKSSGTFT